MLRSSNHNSSVHGKGPGRHRVLIVPEKDKGADKIRLRKIAASAGIPLDLEGLLYKDLEGPLFVEYKSLQIDFHLGEGKQDKPRLPASDTLERLLIGTESVPRLSDRF